MAAKKADSEHSAQKSTRKQRFYAVSGYFGAEGEIRTLARFLDDYSLSRGKHSVENTGKKRYCEQLCEQ